MNLKFILSSLSLLILSLSVVQLNAQDATRPNPPAPPYVTTPTGNYTLLEKRTYKAQANTPPAAAQSALPQTPDLKELDLTKSGELRRDRQTFVDGTSTEIWRSGALRMIVNSIDPNGVLLASKALCNYEDPVDFKELEWIDATTYSGEQLYGDKKCYVFKKGDEMAWVDKQTRLPLAIQSPSVQITYEFGVPLQPLQLPAIISRKVEQAKRAWAGLPN